MAANTVSRNPSDLVLSLPLIVRALTHAGKECDDDVNLPVDIARCANLPWGGLAREFIPGAYLTVSIAKLAVKQAEWMLGLLERAQVAGVGAPPWDRLTRDNVANLGETASILAAVCGELGAHVAITSEAEEEAAAAEPVAPPMVDGFGRIPAGPRRTLREQELADALDGCEELALADDDGKLALGCLHARQAMAAGGDFGLELIGACVGELVGRLRDRARLYPGDPRSAPMALDCFDLAAKLTDCLVACIDDAGAAARGDR